MIATKRNDELLWELTQRLRQQELLAAFGRRALDTESLDALLSEATRVCAEGLDTEFSKVLEYLPADNRFLVRAGTGWAPGTVGHATIGADLESPAGYAFHTGKAVVSNDLRQETRFRTPKLLAQHGVQRALNVIIMGAAGHRFGVLEVDTRRAGGFTAADVNFLQAFGNLLGAAIERAQAKEASVTDKERAKTIVDAAHNYAIITVDLDGTITSWSPGAEAIFGWTESEIRGRKDAVLFTPEDRAAGIPEERLKLAAASGSAEQERWLVRKDGSRFWASGSLRALHDSDGNTREFLKVFCDRTEQREAELRLRESEASFRALANAIPQLAWMADTDGARYWFNERWFRYTGTALEEVQGWGWSALCHPDHRDRVLRGVKAAWKTGQRWEDTYPIRNRDGEYRWFLTRAVPIRDAQDRIVRWFGTNTDVTEQHEAGKYQEMLTREMSHRVRNSLALVASFIMLEARSTSEAGVRRALEDVQKRVTAIANLHDLLWRSLSLETAELASFLDTFCAKLQEATPQHRLLFKGEAVTVPTDVAIPSALLVNELVTNAFKHAFPAGKRGEVTVRLSASPETIQLDVADNGVGLPPGFNIDVADHSLGKRVILAFTRQLGGTLTTVSTGRGACFRLTMPHPRHRT